MLSKPEPLSVAGAALRFAQQAARALIGLRLADWPAARCSLLRAGSLLAGWRLRSRRVTNLSLLLPSRLLPCGLLRRAQWLARLLGRRSHSSLLPGLWSMSDLACDPDLDPVATRSRALGAG